MKNIYFIFSNTKEDFDLVSEIRRDINSFDFKIINDFNAFYTDEIAVTELINQSDVIVAIIGGENLETIFFELGYALAKSRQIILVAKKEVKMPLELRSVQFIEYSAFSSNVLANLLGFLNKINKIKVEYRKNILDSPNKIFTEYENCLPIIDDLSSVDFEILVFNLLKNSGQKIIQNNSKSDYGFDFLIDRLGKYSNVILEVKKYTNNNKISINQVQKFLGSIVSNKAGMGIFISFGDFTASAIEFVKNQKNKIALLNFQTFIDTLRSNKFDDIGL